MVLSLPPAELAMQDSEVFGEVARASDAKARGRRTMGSVRRPALVFCAVVRASDAVCSDSVGPSSCVRQCLACERRTLKFVGVGLLSERPTVQIVRELTRGEL